ncbi:hypothetical protein PHMEG_00015352 [Phytophthora megakarya]|uniref:RxLR effector protein n=1 Tax=Phytophthora megakarya TaxID=4795 RepID=A0A225W323_9STRA|nr:hypothetical protein PHMEG_00015352 [Phytophthora megakarya]
MTVMLQLMFAFVASHGGVLARSDLSLHLVVDGALLTKRKERIGIIGDGNDFIDYQRSVRCPKNGALGQFFYLETPADKEEFDDRSVKSKLPTSEE